MDLPADLAIPGISTPQLALVQPDLDFRISQGRGYPFCGDHVFRGIAQEYGSRRCAHQLRRLRRHPRPLDLLQAEGECPEAAWQAIQRFECPLALTAMAALEKFIGRVGVNTGPSEHWCTG